LDSKTEHEIQEALEQAARGRTVITIAHRLSTVLNADQIIVLESGVVVEKGTHGELLEQNSRYLELWTHQFTEQET
jgi:ATP-binding cassette subfamily B protein